VDSKTAIFKEISCHEAQKVIKVCAEKTTDPVTWGRLLQHIRKCNLCYQLFIQYHHYAISEIANMVIKGEVHVGHCHYSLALEVGMHYPKEILDEYSDGEITKDEKELITHHLATCITCKGMLPNSADKKK